MRLLSDRQQLIIIKRYLAGEPCSVIAEDYSMSKRAIERVCTKHGVIRTRSESFRLAIKQGRVKYYKKPEHLKAKRKRVSDALRHRVMARNKFTCVLCGSTMRDGIRLEIDHINENATDNRPENLQTLCNPCNLGKSHNKRGIGG